MAGPAQDIVDLVIDRCQQDECFPHMSFLAWTVKFRSLLPDIEDILDTVRAEARNDLLREIANRGSNA
jgi:hypothetical protein